MLREVRSIDPSAWSIHHMGVSIQNLNPFPQTHSRGQYRWGSKVGVPSEGKRNPKYIMLFTIQTSPNEPAELPGLASQDGRQTTPQIYSLSSPLARNVIPGRRCITNPELHVCDVLSEFEHLPSRRKSIPVNDYDRRELFASQRSVLRHTSKVSDTEMFLKFDVENEFLQFRT